jgi:hypothetical protein
MRPEIFEAHESKIRQPSDEPKHPPAPPMTLGDMREQIAYRLHDACRVDVLSFQRRV